MKKLIALATVVAFCFIASPTLSAQSEKSDGNAELTETSVTTPTPPKTLKQVEADYAKALKKVTSLEKEMKYIENLKGNKKYKKEVKTKFEEAQLVLQQAEATHQERLSAGQFKALDLPPADATAGNDDEDD